MPTELEELVGFIGHPNPQIRILAVENLVPYSTSQPSIFKTDGFKPIQNLKILIRDHHKIAEHAATILVNLSADDAVLGDLAADDSFLHLLVSRVLSPSEPNANLLCMLLANLAKSDRLHSFLLSKQPPDLSSTGTGTTSHGSVLLLDHLLDVFVRGADGGYNKHADYDHLAYLFADLAKHAAVRAHLVAPADPAVPLAKLKVFTSHRSLVRRQGTANAIKNAAFGVGAHPSFLASAADAAGGDAAVADVLPYVLLPIMGPETYDEDDALDMLPEVQLLPPDKQRDPDPGVVRTHLETLLLLATERAGRDRMREVKVYPIVRELHLHAEDEEVKDACERLVQVLMRDEDGEGGEGGGEGGRVAEIKGGEDEDELLLEV